MSGLRKSTSKETELSNPKSPLGEKVWEIVRRLYQLEPLTTQSLAHLATANQLLSQQALVVYINHTASDVPVAVPLVLAHLTNARRFAGPAGMKHYDFARDPKNAVLLRALRLFNMHALPVVQHNDLDHYTPQRRQQLITNLKNKTRKMLQQPRTIYGIAPEGTRNQNTGTLQQARGIGKLQTYNPNLAYLPVAITYPKYSQNPQVAVGKPLTTTELFKTYNAQAPLEEKQKEQFTTNLLMYHLSLLLPMELRGVYRDF